VGVKDPDRSLSQRMMKLSWGKPDPGDAGRAGSSPDNVGTRAALQKAAVG